MFLKVSIWPLLSFNKVPTNLVLGRSTKNVKIICKKMQFKMENSGSYIFYILLELVNPLWSKCRIVGQHKFPNKLVYHILHRLHSNLCKICIESEIRYHIHICRHQLKLWIRQFGDIHTPLRNYIVLFLVTQIVSTPKKQDVEKYFCLLNEIKTKI